MTTITNNGSTVFRVYFKNEFGDPNFFFNKSVTLVSRNISGKFKKICRLNSLEINFDFFDGFCRQFFFFHHEILKYVSTHVQIFRVPYQLVLEIITVLFRAAKVFHILQDQ